MEREDTASTYQMNTIQIGCTSRIVDLLKDNCELLYCRSRSIISLYDFHNLLLELHNLLKLQLYLI